ncbi:MAG TPA: hypothetical protein VN421_09575 [Pseudoflavonifractor sp.]|nr:hypothetical protein [Pseudoflavonifractor sp.]
MNAAQFAKTLKTSTRIVGGLIRSGTIKATKERGRWAIDPTSAKSFIKKNAAAVERLRGEYVTLYWHGVTVSALQWMTKDDFIKRGIIHPVRGFAEQTIYNSMMTSPTETEKGDPQ